MHKHRNYSEYFNLSIYVKFNIPVYCATFIFYFNSKKAYSNKNNKKTYIYLLDRSCKVFLLLQSVIEKINILEYKNHIEVYVIIHTYIHIFTHTHSRTHMHTHSITYSHKHTYSHTLTRARTHICN